MHQSDDDALSRTKLCLMGYRPGCCAVLAQSRRGVECGESLLIWTSLFLMERTVHPVTTVILNMWSNFLKAGIGTNLENQNKTTKTPQNL